MSKGPRLLITTAKSKTKGITVISFGSWRWMKDLQRRSRTTDGLSKLLGMSSAPGDVRQRSAKPYGLLAGLVKNKALALVRAAPPGDGSEALRQLILLRRLTTQARGPALLSSVTAWPGIVTSKPLQAQLPRHNPNCEYQVPPKSRKIQHGYGHWKLDMSPDSLLPLPRSPLHAPPVLSFLRLQGPPMSTAKMSGKKKNNLPRGRHLVPMCANVTVFPQGGNLHLLQKNTACWIRRILPHKWRVRPTPCLGTSCRAALFSVQGKWRTEKEQKELCITFDEYSSQRPDTIPWNSDSAEDKLITFGFLDDAQTKRLCLRS